MSYLQGLSLLYLRNYVVESAILYILENAIILLTLDFSLNNLGVVLLNSSHAKYLFFLLKLQYNQIRHQFNVKTVIIHFN